MDKFESTLKVAGEKDTRAEPLTATEVKQEATKLENLAKSFIEGDERSKNFKSWHQEMLDLAQHGMQSVHDVFKQMEADSKAQASVDRYFPTILEGHVGNDEQILVENSLAFAGFDSEKYRSINAIVAPPSVFSSGASKNYTDDFQILTKYKDKPQP